MRRTSLTAVFVAVLLALTGYGVSQHKRFDGAPPQTAQPRPAPPPQTAQPRQSTPPSAQLAERAQPARSPQDSQAGRNRPPDAPVVGRAEPRHGPPPRPGHGGHSDVVYYPAPWYQWYGFPWYPYAYPWGYPPPVSIVADWATSNVRLEVTPKDAAVYVDRYYAGTVDSFDGVFQRLTLAAGPHFIEIRKEGYRTLVLDVNLQAGQSIHYKRTMEPGESVAAPGESPEALQPASTDPEQFIEIPGYVHFDVKPKDAEVYADGYYAGIADDFSGGSQLLVLPPGTHHIELRYPNHETATLDVEIRSSQTIDCRLTLVPR